MLLIFAAGSLGKVCAYTIVSNPEDVLRRLVPGQGCLHPFHKISMAGSRLPLSLPDKGNDLLDHARVLRADHGCFLGACMREQPLFNLGVTDREAVASGLAAKHPQDACSSLT